MIKNIEKARKIFELDRPVRVQCHGSGADVWLCQEENGAHLLFAPSPEKYASLNDEMKWLYISHEFSHFYAAERINTLFACLQFEKSTSSDLANRYADEIRVCWIGPVDFAVNAIREKFAPGSRLADLRQFHAFFSRQKVAKAMKNGAVPLVADSVVALAIHHAECIREKARQYQINFVGWPAEQRIYALSAMLRSLPEPEGNPGDIEILKTGIREAKKILGYSAWDFEIRGDEVFLFST